MLRWIGGCAVVAIVLVALGMCFGYRKINDMAAEGPGEAIIVHAAAPRVFAMLAHAESLPEWRMEGLGIRASRSGMLEVGDSLIAENRSGPRPMRSVWHVSTIVPNVLIAFQVRSDTGSVMAVRTDSVIALGDSTRIISSVTATMIDSIRAQRPDTGVETAITNMTSKIFVAAARMQTRAELQRLKARVEGDSTAARPRP